MDIDSLLANIHIMRKGLSPEDFDEMINAMNAKYDKILDIYAKFALDATDPHTILGLATYHILEMINPAPNMTICDLACGEGHLSRQLAEAGASITGVDISEKLLDLARAKNNHSSVRYVLDDAQVLSKLSDQYFDWVICNLALMDIPDLDAVYKSVFRILKTGGNFIFSITHPCFQSPQTTILTDDEGNFLARHISNYATEGLWYSTGKGLRAKVGAYHRTLSTYMNKLLQNKFIIVQIKEPMLPPMSYDKASQQGQVEIPSLMVIKARKK